MKPNTSLANVARVLRELTDLLNSVINGHDYALKSAVDLGNTAYALADALDALPPFTRNDYQTAIEMTDPGSSAWTSDDEYIDVAASFASRVVASFPEYAPTEDA